MITNSPPAAAARTLALALALLLACGFHPARSANSVDDDDDAADAAVATAEVPLRELQQQIENGRARQAVERLLSAVNADPENADLYNLLGFGYRHLGKPDTARRHYDRALTLDPSHKGALEYAGELELLQGDLAAARRYLAALERLCPDGCEELQDLRAALAAAGH